MRDAVLLGIIAVVVAVCAVIGVEIAETNKTERKRIEHNCGRQ